MLENKKQEKIAGIISEFFDGAVAEADIDILAMQIYEKYVAELEQELNKLKSKYEDCENERLQNRMEYLTMKNKWLNSEKELAELKEKAIVPRFKYKDYVYAIYSDKDIFKGQIDIFDYYTKEYLVFFSEDIGNDWFSENSLFAIEQEAIEKLKEIQGNE